MDAALQTDLRRSRSSSLGRAARRFVEVEIVSGAAADPVDPCPFEKAQKPQW